MVPEEATQRKDEVDRKKSPEKKKKIATTENKSQVATAEKTSQVVSMKNRLSCTAGGQKILCVFQVT